MKLHYLHTGESLRILVMGRDSKRIELHVRPVGESVWALVALSGDPSRQPGRNKCQGPYQSAQEAEGAMRAIAQALLEQGFTVERAVHPIWAVQAQRLARAIRDGREANTGDYLFDPDQHEPLW
jgi:hypothetical protein